MNLKRKNGDVQLYIRILSIDHAGCRSKDTLYDEGWQHIPMVIPLIEMQLLVS